MLPTHTIICDAAANRPAPSHSNQEAQSLTRWSNYRQFVLSCRLPATNLLIIYNAGSFAGGPNEDIISQNHDKVACNDYIMTHYLKKSINQRGFNDAQVIAREISKQP